MNETVFAPRVTVSAIIERDGKYLMVEENVRDRLVLNNPAGHLEDNESLVAAIIREVREETGCDFQPEGFTGIYLWKTPKGDKTFLRVNFYGRCLFEDRNAELDDGIIQTHWFTRDELVERNSELRSPMVLRGLDDYRNGCRYPLSALLHLGQGFEE